MVNNLPVRSSLEFQIWFLVLRALLFKEIDSLKWPWPPALLSCFFCICIYFYLNTESVLFHGIWWHFAWIFNLLLDSNSCDVFFTANDWIDIDFVDCDGFLHRSPGLHVLLCTSPLAVCQTPQITTKLSPSRWVPLVDGFILL